MFNKFTGIIAVVVIATLVFTVFGPAACSTPVISDFDMKQDAQGVFQNFKDDWYWLIPEGVSFEPRHMIETRSPNDHEPAYFGKLKIKVIRDHGTAAAFVTYYKETPHIGRIQFVSVNKNSRGKKYGQKLTTYAVNDLFKIGCTEVRLTTRVNNLWAQRIYDRLGFIQFKRYGGFVDYMIKKS